MTEQLATSDTAYEVLVDDNFHYMNVEERWALGKFATEAEAVSACKRLVDSSLAELFESGMTADVLFFRYQSFGDDPFIVVPFSEPRCTFSAWDYARARSLELASSEGPGDSSPDQPG